MPAGMTPRTADPEAALQNRLLPAQPPLTASPAQRREPPPVVPESQLTPGTREAGRVAGPGIAETPPGLRTRVPAGGIRTDDSRERTSAMTPGELPRETRDREVSSSALRADLKATLAALQGLLNQSLLPLRASGLPRSGSTMEPVAGDELEPPLLYTARGFLGGMVDPQEGGPRDRITRATHGAHSAETDAMTQLLRYVEGALARTRVHQLSSLSDPRTTQEGTPGTPAWVMELPIPSPKGFDSLWMRLLEDQGTSGRKSGAAARSWQVMLCLDCAELGPLHARVELCGNRLGATLWAEREGTLEAARAAIGELEDALRTQGVEISRVDCLQGRPPESTGLRFGNLLDVRT